jgi:serine/threonine protein kinase
MSQRDSLPVGRTLAGYEIQKKIGQGGMGEVYQAIDTRLGRKVAIKVLSSELSRDHDLLRRFEAEAKVVAALSHPNIITIFSVEETGDGLKFFTMELVEGRKLQDLIPPGGLDLKRFFEIAIPLTEALTAAHEQGITHRDLKPGNVMITDSGRVKVLDFGLAKLLQPSGTGSDNVPTRVVTRTGFVMGTVPYMSPEQVKGRPVDPRSDIFSLGIILYEMLTGSRPFRGSNDAEVVSSILRDTPPLPTQVRQAVQPELQTIIMTCLEKEPDRRFQHASDICGRLKDLRKQMELEDAISSGRVRAPTTASSLLAKLLKAPGDSLLTTRTGLTLLVCLVFALNYVETAAENGVKRRFGFGTELAYHLSNAAHWLEGYQRFESHDATSLLSVYGYSISYFFLFPLLAACLSMALMRRKDLSAFRVLAVGAVLIYSFSLPFYVFFPVLERWAYPDSGAILLSDLWSSRLIEAFRPMSGLDNCFPSFHVSLTVLMVLVGYLFRLRFRNTMALLACTVLLSTFVLGIHWMADILAGVFVAFLGTAIAFRFDRTLSRRTATSASSDAMETLVTA